MKFIRIFLIALNILIIKNSIAQYVSDFRVTDDTLAVYQVNAKVAAYKNSNFVVLWRDDRDTLGYPFNRRIYYQRFDMNGTPFGINQRVTIENGWIQSNYCLSINRNNILVIGWTETRIDSDSSFFKINFYDSDGVKYLGPLLINENKNINVYGIASANSDNYCYLVLNYAVPGISSKNMYLQKLDLSGNKIGNNTLINDDGMLWLEKSKPEIAMSDNGNFVVVWEDHRCGYASDIYMQRYNSQGQKIGVNQKVNQDNDPGASQGLPDVSCDSIGNYTIVWTDNYQTGYYYLIYAQDYDYNGNMLGNNYRVDQGLVWNRFGSRICKRPDGKWIVGWQDYWANGQNWSPYAQRYDSNRTLIGGNFPITQQLPQIEKRFNDLTMSGDRVISVWTDYRNGNEDIYCNIISFQKPDSIISFIPGSNINIPNDFSLEQNYPNPFNQLSIINFKCSIGGYVSIVVYDLLGREVKTLVNEYKQPGTYQVSFNAEGLSSGVYFYKMTAGEFSETKKMILIR